MYRRRRIYRVLTFLGVVAVIFMTAIRPSAAHADLVSSVPASGETVSVPPTQVLATFSEPPDPSFSFIDVVDRAGTIRGGGQARPVPGHPTELSVPLQGLGNGVYTVTWRTVAADDGHVAAGAFAFRVQQSSSAAAMPGPVRHSRSSPRPSISSVATRWVYYLGAMGLLGGAFVGLVVFRPPPTRLLRWAIPASWMLCMAGCLGISESQRSVAGIPITHLMSSPVGHTMVVRGAAGLEVAVPICLAIIGRGLVRVAGLIAICLTTSLAMLGDVKTTHAAAAHSWPWLEVGVQWVHFMSVGVWLGGLFALLLCLPAVDHKSRAIGVKRFSSAAGVALFLVAGTGALRSIDEVGSWGRLLSSGFGQLVLVKVGVVAVLAVLGAINRYFNVPTSGRTVSALRRVSIVEIGLAALALLITGILQNIAVPVAAAATRAPIGPPPAMTSSALKAYDTKKTTRAGLTVDPASRGENHFRVAITNYRSWDLLSDARVILRFTLTGHPAYGESDLNLIPTGPGVYEAEGGNISADGTWKITIVVHRPNQDTQVSFRMSTTPSTVQTETDG